MGMSSVTTTDTTKNGNVMEFHFLVVPDGTDGTMALAYQWDIRDAQTGELRV
uniref:hypothetical protein n=1 Tax=Burkholderia sp. M701 TaxID=326454 RepID=UPI00159EDC5B|nr:hypothetical protein [Burkholderia sp. M701]